MVVVTGTPEVRPVRAPHPPLGGGALVLRSTGELLITAGVIVLLFVAYLLYWTDFLNDRTQTTLRHTLSQTFAAPLPPSVTPKVIAKTGGVDNLKTIPLGTAYAAIFIPRLGHSYDKVMVEGTEEADLQKGPGHYVNSVLPAQVGNFAVAGHRTTYGKPFNRLAEVKTGDHVVIETHSAWVTYVVTGEQIIASNSTDGYVIEPTPPAIGDQKGSNKLLTFTTCNPEYSATQRLVLRGIWVSTDDKRPGFTPAALQPGAV